MRLNPTQSFQYVRVVRPEEIPEDTPYSGSRSGPPGGAYISVLPGQSISGREILSTYSDEPDWGMDQDLFTIEDYGYGPVAFGSRTGLSSQAQFHMAFLHEPSWVTLLWPGLNRSFMEVRIDLCLALSRLAFDSRADYWGWRFLAWAAHYIQDLTQPYHARAFPLPIRSVLRRFVQDPHPKNFVERNSNILRNHHILFEATVHYLLNSAVRHEPDSALLTAIRRGAKPTAPTVRSLMEHVGGIASSLAVRSDRTLLNLADNPRIDRMDVSLAEEADHKVDKTLREAAADRPLAYEAFLEVLGPSLSEAGGVTLWVLERVRSSLESRR